MPNPLAGFLYGLLGASKALETGIGAYENRKNRELEIAKQRQQNSPLDPQDLEREQQGLPPIHRPASEQTAFIEKTKALQASEDKSSTPVDEGLKTLYKTAGFPEPTRSRVSNTEVSAVKSLAALKSKPQSSAQSNQLTAEEQKALDKAATRKNNPLPTSLIKTRGAAGKTLAQSLIADPDYNPITAEASLSAAKQGASSAARLEASGPPQILARYAQSTKEVLKVADQASKDFPRYGAQFLNTPYIKIKSQTSPQALQFKQVVADLRGHIAAVLAKGYAPQQEQIQEAAQYIPDSITPAQLTADLPFLNKLIDIQVKGMMTPVSGKPEANVPTDISEHVKNIFGGQ